MNKQQIKTIKDLRDELNKTVKVSTFFIVVYNKLNEPHEKNLSYPKVFEIDGFTLDHSYREYKRYNKLIKQHTTDKETAESEISLLNRILLKNGVDPE